MGKNLHYTLKHTGFPSRLPSSDLQFTIRRPNKAGATKLIRRERFADRKNIDRKADEEFLKALIDQFGEAPFERGNLDAGRLSWLFEREVVAAEEPFDSENYEALLQVNIDRSMASFPQIFEDT